MVERNSGSRLRHPILSAQLAWTDRRIRTTKRVLDQARRIINVPQTPASAKDEALQNLSRAGGKLFDLNARREQLERNLHPNTSGAQLKTPTHRVSFTKGDDFFGGYDLGPTPQGKESPHLPKGRLESYDREIPNIVTHLKRLATIVNSPNTSLRQRDLTQNKMDRMNARLQLLSAKREALIGKNR